MSLGNSEKKDACSGIRASGEPSHGPVLTIPNLITFSRLLLLVPLFYFLKEGAEGYGNSWALAIIGLALLTDILDGFLARVLKQATDWGRLFDPLTDKIWLAGLGIFLALPWRANPLPLGFLILVLFRDVTIVLAGIHAYRRRRIVLEANFLGKMSMFLTALTLVSYTVNFESSETLPWAQPQLILWISVVFLVISGLAYFMRYRTLIFSQAATASSSIASSK